MAKNHNFAIAAQFLDGYSALSVQTPQLQPIARAFVRNMNRVRGIGVLPINLVGIAVINETARMEALVNLKVPFHDTRLVIGHANFDHELMSQVDKERTRLMLGWMSATGKEVLGERVFHSAMQRVNLIIDENEAQSWDAVQATMAAMLIGLWTAFESLAHDTWIAAVNARPVPLAERVIEPSANLETGMQLKSISMKEVRRAGFNLTASMGDLLLRQKAVDFQSWKTTRAAYRVAFDGEFESMFEASAVELSRLEAIRNLFVHKGGLVDQKFISRMGNDPAFKDFKDTVGKSLSVTGDYVVGKAESVTDFSTQLATAVDKWLTEHPAEKC